MSTGCGRGTRSSAVASRRPRNSAPSGAAGLVSELHNRTGMRGVVCAPERFRSTPRPVLGAGWRRADRLRGFGSHTDLAAIPSASALQFPLDRFEKSVRLNPVDANVPPDQPPSTPDSPALSLLSLGLSADPSVFETSTFSLPSRNSAAVGGCGVTPHGLTF